MAERTSLRLAATLVFIGYLLFVLALYFHNLIDGKVGNGNNHAAEFTAIAAGGTWTAVHLAQFIATAVITAGVVILSSALNSAAGMPTWAQWANRFGAGMAMVSLALAGVVYAVDGVALKQAADAWVSAPAAEKAARFATAEGIRWLEWGSRSYNNITFGLALVLFAAVIVWTARIPRAIGYLMGVQGLATFALGWQTGAEGFATSTAFAYYLSGAIFFVWIVWLLIIAWRMQESVPVPAVSQATSG